MEIRHIKPTERGVTTLTYVGDDEAVDKAVAGPSLAQLALIGVAAWLLLRKTGR